MVEFVFLNILKLESSNLKHYSNRYELFKFHFNFPICRNYCTGRPPNRPRPGHRPGQWLRQPAHWPAQTGCQAGALPEGTGLWVGPGRGEGRATTRACSLNPLTVSFRFRCRGRRRRDRRHSAADACLPRPETRGQGCGQQIGRAHV